jgi:hypothetical protein
VEDPDRLGLLVRFSANGTFAIDDGGDLATSPDALGTFDLDEDVITFTTEGSNLCTEGDSWAWQASLSDDGRLHFVYTEEAADPCRVPRGREWTLIRVMPRPYIEGAAAIRAITAAGLREGRPPKASDLAGIWFSPNAPLVWFGPDAAFLIDNKGHLDTDPPIRGTYEVDGTRSRSRSGRPRLHLWGQLGVASEPTRGWAASYRVHRGSRRQLLGPARD